MRNYQHLFRAITDIMRQDYAGISLCAGAYDPRYYNQAIGQAWNDGVLDDVLFLRYVRQMMACTGDRGLSLTMLPAEGDITESVGFTVRRLGDELIVTECTTETRLCPGDRIVRINGGTLSHHRKAIQKNFFYSDVPEREDWSMLLSLADTVYTADGRELTLSHYAEVSAERMPGIEITGSTAYIDAANFNGDGVLAELLEQNAAVLSGCERIIWDLRRSGGASDADFSCLLPWAVCKETTMAQLMGEPEIYVNYSRRNCALRILTLGEDAKTAPYRAELKQKAGKGLLLGKIPCEDMLVPVRSRAKILLLTDITTADAAEAFAAAAGRGGAVRLGRATRGTGETFSSVSQFLDDRFIFTWPMAVSAAAYRGETAPGRGLPPDIEIPFTIDETQTDLLRDAAEKL